MTFHLSHRSEERLRGVHADLARVVRLAILRTQADFTVLEGWRSQKRQQSLFASGASRTRNSRHLTGHAVDLGAWVGGEVRWDWSFYQEIARSMHLAATELHIPLQWGGDWPQFRDGTHFQLPWKEYPA